MRKYFSGICFSEKGTQVLLYSIITNIFLSGTEYRFSKLNYKCVKGRTSNADHAESDNDYSKDEKITQ